jgi:hypothetical protein
MKSTSLRYLRSAAICAAVSAIGLLAVSAWASSSPDLTLTITPSTTGAGHPVDVVMTATNTSGHALDSSQFPALGINVASSLQGTTSVVAKPGTSCRWATVPGYRLYYCAWPQTAPGSTVTIRLSINPSVSGNFKIWGYARYGLSQPDTIATQILTVL